MICHDMPTTQYSMTHVLVQRPFFCDVFTPRLFVENFFHRWSRVHSKFQSVGIDGCLYWIVIPESFTGMPHDSGVVVSQIFCFLPYLGQWSNLRMKYGSKGLKPPTTSSITQYNIITCCSRSPSWHIASTWGNYVMSVMSFVPLAAHWQ